MATTYNNFSDQRQFLVSVAGISGSFWAQVSGGDVSVPTAKVYDGGNPTPGVITGNPVVDDLVLTRAYDPNRDAQLSQKMKATLASGKPFKTTIKQIPTDPAYASLGKPADTWTGQLTRVTTPKTDALKTGASNATLALTFTCTKLT